MVIELTQEEYDDFMEEPETQPFAHIEQQLNGAESVAEFNARGKELGYDKPTPHWTDLFSEELAQAEVEIELEAVPRRSTQI